MNAATRFTASPARHVKQSLTDTARTLPRSPPRSHTSRRCPMAKYASETTVSAEKSRGEIETVLKRYGASHFGYMSAPDRVVIGFQAHATRVKFELPLPDPKARAFTHKKGRQSWHDDERTPLQAEQAHAQAVRQCWRALLLVIKAKLEAVDAEITTFEEEFLAHIVLPNGQTVGASLLPRIQEATASGQMPALAIGFDKP